MTIDEAIAHALEVAEKNECKMTSDDGYTDVSMKRCAAEHRQLAEWLTELKEAKRLLKSALATFNDASCNKDCCQCKWNNEGCEMSCRFAWIHTDEALKLIGEDENL